jgi:hypothetical protein
MKFLLSSHLSSPSEHTLYNLQTCTQQWNHTHITQLSNHLSQIESYLLPSPGVQFIFYFLGQSDEMYTYLSQPTGSCNCPLLTFWYTLQQQTNLTPYQISSLLTFRTDVCSFIIALRTLLTKFENIKFHLNSFMQLQYQYNETLMKILSPVQIAHLITKKIDTL